MTRQEHIREALDTLAEWQLNEVARAMAEEGHMDWEDVWEELDLREIRACQCYDTDNFEAILRAAYNRDFDPGDAFWRWGAYGPESCNSPSYDLDDMAECIDDNADCSWVNYLPSEITDAIEEYASEPDDPLDPTDWPDDPTDYDGEDEDEDEPAEAADPAPAEGIRVTTYGGPLNPEEARRAMQRLFPTLMGMFDSTPENSDLWQSQVVNTIAQNCLANSGRYPIGDADLITSTYRVFPGAAAADDQPA
jgi:hypothetical protein